MAYTTCDDLDRVGEEYYNIGEGNWTQFPSYFPEDLAIILTQPSADSQPLRQINAKFRGEEVTILAVIIKDSDNNEVPLPKVALPCPPWGPRLSFEALPGKYLGEEVV
ncbi:MAG: hypothetical protein HY842_03710 [Bacteroidetes bacterium]|nr:hypothetical protein [Bacteroidota bacterium]